jgi:hypothetical protein
MSLIPEVSVERIQKVLENDVGSLPSCEIVNGNGEYLATLIVPAKIGGQTVYDHIRTQADYLGLQGNTVLPVKALEEGGELVCLECGFCAASAFGLQSHRRVHND